MATYVPAKRATELIFYMGLVSQSTGQFQTNPTLAAGDVKVSKDGGALANLTTLPAVTPAASKMVKVTISSTEMTADNVTLVFSDAAGAEWDDVIINIQTAARQIDDLAYPTVSGRSVDVTATGAAGIDWANIENATQVQNMSGTTISTVVTVSGNVNGSVNTVTNRVTANTDRWAGTVIPAPTVTGVPKVDLTQIDGAATSGWNATLYLNQLNIRNTAGSAIQAISTVSDGVAFKSTATGYSGLFAEGPAYGIEAIAYDDNGVALYTQATGTNGHGARFIGAGTGKSIDASQDVALPSGDLDDQLQAIDNFIDTEVTAIKAKTDSLPADPADASDIAASFTTVNSKLDTIDDFLDTEVAAIKAKTDQLTFTSANHVDANIQKVNDVTLTGDGSTTPWGPV
jgi:hypothetical protein